MAKELLRLKQSLVNKPLLSTIELADFAFDYINSRGLEENLQQLYEGEEKEEEVGGYFNEVSFNKDTNSAVINLNGAMTYRQTFWQAMCGGVSYQGLISDFASLVNQGATTVVFMVDSGGGEAYQCFPTANEIRSIANEYGVKILAAVDGLSASAAYAITSIADEIVLLEGSEVGSIGVVVRLMNDTKALDKAGYERSFIVGGEDKVPYSADGSFSEAFTEDIQEKVNETYDKFIEHVAYHRGLSKELVKSTKAAIFTGEKALELGLVDKIMTLYEFMDYSADYIQLNNGDGLSMPLSKFISKEKEKEDGMDLKQLTEMNEELVAENAEFAQQVAQVTEQLSSKEVELKESLNLVKDLQEEITKMEAQAKEAQQEARKSKLAAVLSEDKVEGMLTSLEGLSDEAFDQVVATFSMSVQATKDSEMFQSLGTSTHAATLEEDETEEDLTLKMLKERYAQ